MAPVIAGACRRSSASCSGVVFAFFVLLCTSLHSANIASEPDAIPTPISAACREEPDILIPTPTEAITKRDSWTEIWTKLSETPDYETPEERDRAYEQQGAELAERAVQKMRRDLRYWSNAPSSPQATIQNVLEAIEKRDWSKYRDSFESTTPFPDAPTPPGLSGLFSNIQIRLVAADDQIAKIVFRALWTPSSVEESQYSGKSLRFCREIAVVRSSKSRTGFIQWAFGGVYEETPRTGWYLRGDQQLKLPFDFTSVANDVQAAATQDEIVATAHALAGSISNTPWTESGSLALEQPIDFANGSKLRIVVGGSAEYVLVRLLPHDKFPNEPGFILGKFKVPPSRLLSIDLDRDYDGIVQIGVFGGRTVWDVPLGPNNGPASLEFAGLERGQ